MLILLARRERAVAKETSTANNIVHTHTHSLQVQYQHTHAFVPSASANKDLAQSLAAAERLIRHPKPGQLVPNLESQSQAQDQSQVEPTPSLRTSKRMRRLVTNATNRVYASIKPLDLICLVTEIPDPPALSYKDRLSDLIHDWLFGSDLKCNGVNVPLEHWRAVYKPFRPNVWAKIKAEWGEWRVSNALL
jgi:hypothetical protein